MISPRVRLIHAIKSLETEAMVPTWCGPGVFLARRIIADVRDSELHAFVAAMQALSGDRRPALEEPRIRMA